MMKLGNLQFNYPLFLAPMSGITDYPFRQLAREMGCGLVFTEMVSAEGLLRKGEAFLKIGRDEHPVSVQLFGSNQEVLAEAAARAETIGADAIDLNMGCPAKQVIKTGAGVDLMRFPKKVKGILVEMKKKVKCPLTIKIRSGWDEKHINAIEISKLAEECGVDAISIHPRTKDQAFRGRADWNLIGEVKRVVHIPVIGNGDVTTPSLAKKMLEETGCDGVMIGRGALGNPWIFSTKISGPWEKEPAISLEERQQMIDHHFLLIQNHYGDKGVVREIRKYISWYTKGLPYCASFHSKLSGLKEKEALFGAIHSYFDSIQRRKPCQLFASTTSRSVTG
ncbi:MAG: tRNA dihydrouridine synthase DusB [Thermodesulfobacteriota bacterium]